MDFTFSKEHQLFRQTVHEFAEQEIKPLAQKVDKDETLAAETIRKLGDAGLLGVPFPQKYGGAGLGETGYCILMEEIGRVCTSTATLIGAHIGIGTLAIYMGGTEAQKMRYLPDLCTGRKIASFCLTEPGAGSDAAAIRTRAIRDGHNFIITGSKIYITNGPIASTFSVMAMTDPALGARGGATAFIVEKGTPGLSVGKIEHKMGIRGSATSEIVFDEVCVPTENVIGQVGAGFVTFMQTLDSGRLGLGAASLGGIRTALDYMAHYAAGRQQFGKPIGEKQSIQWMIAETATDLELLYSLVYRTAWLVDTGQAYSREAAVCKLFGSSAASRAIDRALQVHGALGYSRDFPLERMWRDARIGEIFEGTNEVQHYVIAEEVLKPYGVRVRP
jgi:alkylation response protein AidB-like acyl-CoA dehydrogenase